MFFSPSPRTVDVHPDASRCCIRFATERSHRSSIVNSETWISRRPGALGPSVDDFTSFRPGFVEEDRNEASDVFLYDRYSGSLRTLSTRPTGATGMAPVSEVISAPTVGSSPSLRSGDLLPGMTPGTRTWCGRREPGNPVDTDADGLPMSGRDWFGSLDQDAAGDPDGDGQSNLDEYHATSPWTPRRVWPCRKQRFGPTEWRSPGRDIPGYLSVGTE